MSQLTPYMSFHKRCLQDDNNPHIPTREEVWEAACEWQRERDVELIDVECETQCLKGRFEDAEVLRAFAETIREQAFDDSNESKKTEVPK